MSTWRAAVWLRQGSARPASWIHRARTTDPVYIHLNTADTYEAMVRMLSTTEQRRG